MWFRRFISLVMCLATSACFAGVACSDWTIPLSFSAGGTNATITLGVQNGATNSYDPGKDTPSIAYSNETVYVVFPHPEWGVSAGKAQIDGFIRDIRGSLPQEYSVKILSTQPQVTVNWPSFQLTSGVKLSLRDPITGTILDMSESNSYTFKYSGNSYNLIFNVIEGDSSPPAPPRGLSAQERKDAIYLSWENNFESDIKGYKVHYRNEKGTYRRTTDVKNVTNFSLLNLFEKEIYTITLTAYDADGNESGRSEAVTAGFNFDREPPLSPVGLSLYITDSSSFELSWYDNSEADLSEYIVYYGTAFGQYSHKAEVGKMTNYSLASPVEGKTYHFVVTALDMAGNESEFSNPISLLADFTPPEIDEVSEDTTRSTSGSSYASSIVEGNDGQESPKATDGTQEADQRGKKEQERTDDSKMDPSSPENVSQDELMALAFDVIQEPGDGGILRHKILFDNDSWKLLSIPLFTSQTKPFKEFAALSAEWKRLTGWDAEKKKYEKLTSLRPGKAFWLRSGKGYCVVEGSPVEDKTFTLNLKNGWNLVGNPYLIPLGPKNIQVINNGQTFTFFDAIKRNVLADEYRVFEKGELRNKSFEKKSLILPWHGYWLYVSSESSLLFSKAPFAESIVLTKKEQSPATAKGKNKTQ